MARFHSIFTLYVVYVTIYSCSARAYRENIFSQILYILSSD